MMHLPKKLFKGDTIGLVSPAGGLKNKSDIEACSKYFQDKGYKVKIAPHVADKKAYLAGKDEDRLQDLLDMFKDDEVKAILCTRGGYGTYRLLDKFDFEVVKRNPKIFVGYSDITSLLNNFVCRSDIVTFHGPLAVSAFGIPFIDEYTETNFWEILEGKVNIPFSYEKSPDYKCISPGEAEGVLMGGNLTVLTGLLGTPYFPSLEGSILLLEDIGEPLYKIDRMLTQLKLAGVFKGINAVLFGEFSNAGIEKPEELSFIDFAKEFFEEYKIPVGYGFSASHEAAKSTLPMGIKYKFSSSPFKLEITEKYLSD